VLHCGGERERENGRMNQSQESANLKKKKKEKKGRRGDQIKREIKRGGEKRPE